MSQMIPSLKVFQLNFCMHFSPLTCVLCALLISHFLIFITLIIFSEGYKLWSSSLCSFLQWLYFLPVRSKFSPQHPVLKHLMFYEFHKYFVMVLYVNFIISPFFNIMCPYLLITTCILITVNSSSHLPLNRIHNVSFFLQNKT